MTDDAAWAGVADRLAIQDVLFGYARALDTRDWALLSSCFTPDVVATYDELGEQVGYPAVERLCRAALLPLAATQHLIGNVEVWVDGDHARSRCNLQSMHVRTSRGGADNFIVAGVYQDELRRTGDGWRIARRRLQRVWTHGDLTGHGQPPAAAEPTTP